MTAEWTSHLVITVYGKPAPQGSKRHVGRGVMIESSKYLRPWREAVKDAARLRVDQAGGERVEGPVRVDVVFAFDKPRSAPKTRRTWPITRSSGDVDKLARGVLDALVDAGALRDDSQVVQLRARKVFVDDPTSPLHIPGALISISWPIEP